MAKKTDDSLIKDALERFKESQDASGFNRQDAYDDIRFSRLGDQWPKEVRDLRRAEGRPCLTINRLPAFIRQVVNDARQNKPGIKVHPVDSGADIATAQVIDGLIKSIERGSNADLAYDTAIDHAVSGGFGFFRIEIDYVHDRSFDLEARIERIPNPLMVHWDVSSTGYDAADWEYAFVSDFVTEEQFKQRYPKSKPVSFDGDYRDYASYWLEDRKIRLAEYWLKTERKETLYLLSNGVSVLEGEIPRMASAMVGVPDISAEDAKTVLSEMGIAPIRERQASVHEVKRRIVSGVEVLQEDDWPGSTIPICPVWGEEVYLDGRRHFRSMIRDAKDPQTMYNFWRSSSTELVALAPRAPFIGPRGFVPKGQEQKWQTANTRSHAYLEYEGNVPPQRQPFAGVPAGAIQEALNASDDIKAITGIYDPSLGARSNETSGRAILARQKESDVSNFHFVDNLSRAIKYAGQVLVEIIPSVYSTRETVRILGEDMKPQVVQLTQESPDSNPGPDGQPRLYNLNTGKYDVSVEAGASFATQREEARETLIQIIQQLPQAAPVLGDLLLKNMDFVGADEAAQRIKALAQPPMPGQIPPQPIPQ